MSYYKIDEETVWESTDDIIVDNYPPYPLTYTYITRVYREYKKGKYGWKPVNGEPIYLHDIRDELAPYLTIIGEAQNILSKKLPIDKFLGEPVDPNNLFL